MAVEQARNRPTGKAQHRRRRGFGFAARELVQVLWAWVTGEGNLFGLLDAWWEVVSGQVAVGDEDE
jgi:hypothetical protein